MTQVAFTETQGSYPGYVNFNKSEDGMTITVRGAPTKRDGVFICGFAPRDKGQSGRCTPGDANCNNYCNHDTSRPMADAPESFTHTDCGPVASLTLTASQWAEMASKLGE